MTSKRPTWIHGFEIGDIVSWTGDKTNLSWVECEVIEHASGAGHTDNKHIYVKRVGNNTKMVDVAANWKLVRRKGEPKSESTYEHPKIGEVWESRYGFFDGVVVTARIQTLRNEDQLAIGVVLTLVGSPSPFHVNQQIGIFPRQGKDWHRMTEEKVKKSTWKHGFEVGEVVDHMSSLGIKGAVVTSNGNGVCTTNEYVVIDTQGTEYAKKGTGIRFYVAEPKLLRRVMDDGSGYMGGAENVGAVPVKPKIEVKGIMASSAVSPAMLLHDMGIGGGISGNGNKLVVKGRNMDGEYRYCQCCHTYVEQGIIKRLHTSDCKVAHVMTREYRGSDPVPPAPVKQHVPEGNKWRKMRRISAS